MPQTLPTSRTFYAALRDAAAQSDATWNIYKAAHSAYVDNGSPASALPALRILRDAWRQLADTETAIVTLRFPAAG